MIGIANASAVSNATATSEIKLIEDDLPTANADSKANGDAKAQAIGIDNKTKIKTDKGHDTILGVANALASSSAIADSQAAFVSSNIPGAAISNSIATVNVLAEAVGIRNTGHISTGIGRDMILGIANADASGSATAKSQAKSLFSNNSSATANSESTVIVNALAIGIDNIGKITTGRGHDIVVGVASTSAMSEAEAQAFTHNTTALVNECDPVAINAIGTALSGSTSTATAITQTTTLGIVNPGKILMDRGNDVLIGLAYNSSLSNGSAISEAKSIANNEAIATADAASLAIASSNTVGIANFGKINTGRNNDTVIGIAINLTTATVDANADAIAQADDSDAQTDSNAIADVSEALSIGIDNTSGLLITANGNDQVIGIGDIGISGGKIRGDGGHDRIFGYGSTVGVADSKIKLGQGNDFFKAAIVKINPFTGEISDSSDQSGSIKNAIIIGDRGNDTFEIGGFESTVSIDGGKHHDVLKLWGNIENYEITLGSSGDKSLTIEAIDDSNSILAVKNVEVFYFGNSNHAYSYHDFA